MSMDKLLMQVALIDQVTKPLRGITKQMTATANAGRQGMQNMASGGGALVASGFAIQAALMPAILMDRKLGEVKSLGVMDEDLKQLSGTALELSIQYGKSAVDVVNSAYDIKSAFGDINGDELSDITKSSAILAAATKADASTITNYMGTMYGIFKNSADEAGLSNWSQTVAGMTAKSVEMFKTTGAGMSSAFTSIGADATSSGIVMSEQMAILGTLQATMSGSEAGTKYRAFIGGVAKAQDALNLSFTDSQGKMLPMLDILGEIKGKYGDTFDEFESAELAKAFGTKEATGMIKLLMADTDGLARSIETLGQVQGMSKAEEMAAAMTDQWQRLEAVSFALRAAIFGAVLPSINAVVGSMVDGVSVIMVWLEDFPILTECLGYVAIAAISLGGVVGALSLAMGIGQLMSGGWGLVMGTLGGIFKLLRIQMILMTASTWLFNAALWANPMTWVVAVIVGLIAAVGAAIYYWDEIKASFGDTAVFKMLSDMIDWLIDKLNMLPGVNIGLNTDELKQIPEITAAQQSVQVTPELSALPALPDMSAASIDTVAMADIAALSPNMISEQQAGLKLQATNDEFSANNITPYHSSNKQQQLPASMVQNATTITQSQGGNTRQYGDIYISSEQAMTPDQLAEWDELNAG